MTTAKNAGEWESAWTAYVEAQSAFDETLPKRFERGFARRHRGNLCRLRDAKKKLRKLDPEFCESLEI